MMRFDPSALGRRTTTIAVAIALLCGAGSIAPAAASDVCISMSGSPGTVAGIQLDLKWDGNCMSADKGSGTSARCTADPSTGKDIRAAIKPGPTLKAIFFSMADTNPIPDGDLFCCSFTRSSSAGNACCGLTMGNVLGSDPVGTAIQASAFNLLATMDGQPCTASQGGGGGQQGGPVRSGLQGGGGGVAPPVVSAPGAAAPAAPVQQAPAGGGRPAIPGGNIPVPEVPSGMEQVQRALQQLTPREAPTPAEPTAAAEVVTPQPTRAAGTPTAKARATEAHGTPTAAAKATPSAAVTPESKTPAATPEATPKARHKRKHKHEKSGS
jgi:hypothetical protein